MYAALICFVFAVTGSDSLRIFLPGLVTGRKHCASSNSFFGFGFIRFDSSYFISECAKFDKKLNKNFCFCTERPG